MPSSSIFTRKKQRARSRRGMQLFLCILPALLAFAILLLVRLLPAQTVERVYSRKIFPAISGIAGLLGGAVSFSLAEWILALLGTLALIAGVAFFLLMAFSHRRSAVLWRYLLGLLAVPSVILLLFAVTCAPNYHRLTFADQAGLELRASSIAELEALCTDLIAQTNDARAAVEDVPFPTFEAMRAQSLAAFNSLAPQYPFLGQARVGAKPVRFSHILSAFNLTGFYFPYTGEANVNTAMPQPDLAFTICHELSHTVGFMREDEANFIGYLACLQTEDASLRYSGLYNAMIHSMNALYAAVPDRYFALQALYSPQLADDVRQGSQYWQHYQNTPAATLSEKVNDTYLKANALPDGIQSYGRMVDLLLAYHREIS